MPQKHHYSKVGLILAGTYLIIFLFSYAYATACIRSPNYFQAGSGWCFDGPLFLTTPADYVLVFLISLVRPNFADDLAGSSNTGHLLYVVGAIMTTVLIYFFAVAARRDDSK